MCNFGFRYLKGGNNEDQADQRLCGRPGEGSALLYRSAGLCQEGRLQHRGRFAGSPWPRAEDPNGTELQLALNNNPAAKAYQQAIFQQGQPAAMFFTDDIKGDYERIKTRGAEFTMPPTDVTGSTIAMLKDTCGNIIQIVQLVKW